MAQQPVTINQMMQAYQQLTTDFQARRMDKASYSAALTRLRAIDAEKRWWSCTLQDGFVWYDGSRWIPGETGDQSTWFQPITGASTGFTRCSAEKNPPLKGWRKIASTPFLAVLPGAVIGGLWFLYTLLRMILGGTGGVDILTPAILTGLPLLLWLLRKPLDKILFPLQKILGSFPYTLRLVIALAVPMMFGFGCAAISTTGNTAMFLTALTSTLFGYFLLHQPAARNIS